MRLQLRHSSICCCLVLLLAIGLQLHPLLSSLCFAQSHETGLLGKGKSWQTPFYVNDSAVEGPTVVITGGIHGNEPAASRAADQICHWPIVCGKLIVLPKANTAGLKQNTRYIPEVPAKRKDLNRNFPSPGIADEPRGEIATALWNFVVAQDPDWLFDLHEGYEFHISHRPKEGKQKSVGSSIIYDRNQGIDLLVERMLIAANGKVTDPDRRFVPLGRGPKKTTLASAAIHALNAKAMILETTFQHQRLPIRTRQHRVMMSVALKQLGMIEDDCVDVLIPPESDRSDQVFVGLYDGEGSSERGVENVTRAFDAAPEVTVVHLGPADIRTDVLSQFDVVVFGGGSGSKQARTIDKDGATSVRSFVKNGGGYVGICAGAYLCSAHYDWSLNLVDTRVFTGTREVEKLGPKQMWYRGKFTSQKMQLTEKGREVFPEIPEHVDVRYQNSPIVSPKNFPGLKAYTPLAYFRSEQVLYPPQKGTMINTPAIVSGMFGKGRVISISPHPEATKGLESMVATAVKAVARRRDYRTVTWLNCSKENRWTHELIHPPS